MALPVMTPEMSAAALEKAREARAARAELKDKLKRGEVTLPEALKAGVAAKMKVSALVGALPGMGKVTTAHLMDSLGIAGNRRVRGLGANQRAALEKAFAPVPA